MIRSLKAWRLLIPRPVFDFVRARRDALAGSKLLLQTDQFARSLPQTTATPSPGDDGFGLVDLGERFVPTKRAHNYLPRYDHVLGARRREVRKMVEIGVQTDSSVRMWRDYFPNAQIIGIDIDPDCKRFETDRINIAIGDQTDHLFLRRFIQEHFGTIDVLVDDGLHSPHAIKTSFQYLYPALSSHGIYAIEDVVNHGYVPALAAAIVQAINYWPKERPIREWQILADLGSDAGWFAKHTIGMEFYRHILFVKRGLNPQDNPFIMPAAEYQAALNENLRTVDEAAKRLTAEGKPLTSENLISLVGFQLHHYVDFYLSGMRASER